MQFGCASAANGVTYRVFDYSTLGLANEDDTLLSFSLECVEFAYILMGKATFTVDVYVDSTGGNPDCSSMSRVGDSMSGSVESVPVSEETGLFTVQPSSPISFTLPDKVATVVVALTVNSMDGSFHGRGQHNPSAVGTTYKEYFFTGSCEIGYDGILPVSLLNDAADKAHFDELHWQVQLKKSSSTFQLSSEPLEMPFGVPSQQPTNQHTAPTEVQHSGRLTYSILSTTTNFNTPKASRFHRVMDIGPLSSTITNFITHKPHADISRVTSEFGERVPPKLGASRFHKAIDIGVREGKVYAAHNGTIRRKYFQKAGGNLVEVQCMDADGTRYATTYAHLKSFATIADANGVEREIAKDDYVTGGTHIGEVGNTGSASSGPHLHLITRINGEPQNPRTYLAQAFPAEFPTAVNAANFGIELQGDYRDNTLTGNSNSNRMNGGLGDDFYILKTIKGQNVISDPDGDGKLQIGSVTMKNSVMAHAKFYSLTGQVIPGYWSVSGFDLERVNLLQQNDPDGIDLVIFESGDSEPMETRNQVVIRNYPFDSDLTSFGINLGLMFDGYGSTFHKDAGYGFGLITNERDKTSLFKTKSGESFFTIVSGSEYNGKGGSFVFVRTFNAKCKAISTQFIITYYNAYMLKELISPVDTPPLQFHNSTTEILPFFMDIGNTPLRVVKVFSHG